jgi:hypothetical protein
MPEGRVYTITVRGDLQKLLVDRLIYLSLQQPQLVPEINNKNFSDELAIIKEESVQFDPFNAKTQHSFYASEALSDEQFTDAKNKVYGIFSAVADAYDEDVRVNLIEQPIDDEKFSKFTQENIESYAKARVLFRVGSFIRNLVPKVNFFGYNTLLNKDQFVAQTNVHYTNGNQFGEDLARSEDNKILEEIYRNFNSVQPLTKELIGPIVQKEKDLSSIVLWVNGYFNIQDTNQASFKPYWQEENSKEDKGPYYQGSIDNVPVYMVFKFDDHREYPDSVFLFGKNSFSIEEFTPQMQTTTDDGGTKVSAHDDPSVYLSITNLSDNEDERVKIVEKWIVDGKEPENGREKKLSELKTEVVLKFFKGLDVESLKINKEKIKIFRLR